MGKEKLTDKREGQKVSKAVLFSIQPLHCFNITTGKKGAEVRKGKPKIDTPFKAYIYCTKNKIFFTNGCMRFSTDDLYRLPNGEIKYGCSVELMSYGDDEYDESNFLNGKVIGEFICNRVDYWRKDIYDDNTIYLEELSELSCVSEDGLLKYADGGELYALHISDLVIYDKPKDLTEFKRAGFLTEENWLAALYPNTHCHYEAWAKKFDITRPPQSYCFVEELQAHE